MHLVGYIVSPGLGRSARRCRFLRPIEAPGFLESWVVDAYPPIAGFAADATVVLEIRSLKYGLKDLKERPLSVDIHISPLPMDDASLGIRNFRKLDEATLVDRVPDDMFPFDGKRDTQ